MLCNNAPFELQGEEANADAVGNGALQQDLTRTNSVNVNNSKCSSRMFVNGAVVNVERVNVTVTFHSWFGIVTLICGRVTTVVDNDIRSAVFKEGWFGLSNGETETNWTVPFNDPMSVVFIRDTSTQPCCHSQSSMKTNCRTFSHLDLTRFVSAQQKKQTRQ